MHNKKLYNQIINSISKVVKKQINEAFDFDTINKKKKSVNIYYDILYNTVNKIINDIYLDDDEKEFILSLPSSKYRTNNKEIHKLVNNCVKIFGNNCNLNWIDVSAVTDMSHLFSGEVIDIGELSKMNNFNGDISKWDVTNVTNMASMFECSEFAGNISKWNVSNVTNMNSMFYYSVFNGNISKWNVSNVIDMRYMFMDSNFNKDISKWNINNKCNTDNIFSDCQIKNKYKPQKTKINESFSFSSVNKSKNPTNIYSKFHEILGKSYSEITEEDKDFINLFPDGIYKVSDKDELKKIIKRTIRLLGYDCNLNWIDVSNITDMSNLFQNTKFNGDISRWDVSNVTDMKEMFWRSEFDGDISRWDVSNVTNMQGMFMNSLFNGDINNWDVSNVTNMHCMFHNTEFNNNISQWDVSNVIYMSGMFDNSPFNKDISNWKINPNCKIDFIFAECPIEEKYKPKKFRL